MLHSSIEGSAWHLFCGSQLYGENEARKKFLEALEDLVLLQTLLTTVDQSLNIIEAQTKLGITALTREISLYPSRGMAYLCSSMDSTVCIPLRWWHESRCFILQESKVLYLLNHAI